MLRFPRRGKTEIWEEKGLEWPPHLSCILIRHFWLQMPKHSPSESNSYNRKAFNGSYEQEIQRLKVVSGNLRLNKDIFLAGSWASLPEYVNPFKWLWAAASKAWGWTLQGREWEPILIPFLNFLKRLTTNFLQKKLEVVSLVFSLILFEMAFSLDMVFPHSVTSNFSLIGIWMTLIF